MKYLGDEALAKISGELAMLLHAGLDIAGGLAMLAEDREGLDGELLTALRRDAEEGLPLSECMERSGAFPPEVCAQVRCGERTGRLEETLSPPWRRAGRPGCGWRGSSARPCSTPASSSF